MLGGRKCTCPSKSPGSPSPSQNARTGATSSLRSGGSVTHALQPATHGLLGLAGGLPLGQRVPLVPGLLALGQGDLDLGAAVEEVESQGHDREPLLRDLPLDLVDLL